MGGATVRDKKERGPGTNFWVIGPRRRRKPKSIWKYRKSQKSPGIPKETYVRHVVVTAEAGRIRCIRRKKFFGTNIEMTVFYKFVMRSCYTGHVYILVCRIWSCSQKIAKCVSNCRAECTGHYSQRKSRCRRFSFSVSRSASFGKIYGNRKRLALHFVLALSSKFWCVSSSGLVMGPLTHTIDFYHRRSRRWRNGFLHVNLVKRQYLNLWLWEKSETLHRGAGHFTTLIYAKKVGGRRFRFDAARITKLSFCGSRPKLV